MAKPWLSDLLGKATDTQPAEKVAHLPVSSDKLLKQISELQGRLVQEQCEEGKIERAREEALADLAELIAVRSRSRWIFRSSWTSYAAGWSPSSSRQGSGQRW